MRPMLAAATLLLAIAQPAFADTCQDRFVDLMVNRDTTTPVRIHVTQEIVGAATTVNWNLQDGKGNWRTEMIDPENSPWSMVADEVMYFSTDQGKTWAKVRDAKSDPDATAAALEDRAKTVSNAQCGQDEIDGKSYETTEADYEMQAGAGTAIHEKLWVDPETGLVARSEMRMRASNFESFTTQVIEPSPGLEIAPPQ